jgi:hypothetical protein
MRSRFARRSAGYRSYATPPRHSARRVAWLSGTAAAVTGVGRCSRIQCVARSAGAVRGGRPRQPQIHNGCCRSRHRTLGTRRPDTGTRVFVNTPHAAHPFRVSLDCAAVIPRSNGAPFTDVGTLLEIQGRSHGGSIDSYRGLRSSEWPLTAREIGISGAMCRVLCSQ